MNMRPPVRPERVSHYSILNKLGAGGMGEVYLAEDTNLHRRVAIKFLPAEATADKRANKRLIREAQAAATLDHPNICAVYEVNEEGRSFIVMQYVEGETLASRIRTKPLDLKECLEIAAQIADALVEAHSHGIIHRDIKPQNIMLTARHQAKVMDFGLAQVIREESLVDSEGATESLLTLPGTIVGTVAYMSPEQVRGETLDARSDIFSFGAVLYEMLTGHQPFAAESAAMTISAIVSGEPVPLARYSRDVPSELERILSKALHKDRDERYQTTRDLLIDLRSLKHHLEIEKELERSAAPTAPSAKYTASSIRQHRASLTIALAALVILIALSLGYWFYNRSASTVTQINSIAVLPFTNESGNPDVEYLSDGMTESLINSLSQLPNMRVIARSTMFSFKGKARDHNL